MTPFPMARTALALACAWMTSGAALAQAQAGPVQPTLMLRQPAVSQQHLAFVYAGDLWLADRSGANARRLTGHAASEFAPRFSPDGRRIAFSASYDGNTDVYVIGLDGGTPTRLTWHPAPDVVNGWSPDGQRVLFASPREVLNNRSNQLYEVGLQGGYEKQVMKAVAYEGAWSPDGRRLAYRPYRAAYVAESGWRQSRGGTTPPVWIMDMASQQWEQIPHVNATDSAPVWAGGEVVFISDRADGAANLFAFNPATKALRQLTRETQWDVRSVDAQGSTLVYEAGGVIKQLDLTGPAGGAPQVLPISLAAVAPQVRPQWRDAGKALTSARLSATGKRVVVSARGEVFTVPVKDGSVRNLTETAGVREKDALWSADGRQVAYLSDAPGMRHELVLAAQDGLGAKERFPLPKAGYFTLLEWSPDGRHVVLQDNHLNLYRLSLASVPGGAPRGQLVKVATDVRRGGLGVTFSPDSRWLAYTSSGDNYFGRIWLHEIATGRNHAVTDGLAHAGTPAFSPKGDLLYFTASINTGPSAVGLDLSTQERPRRAGLYALVLAADGKSPLAPKPGDEDGKKDAGKDEKKDDKKADAGKDEKSDAKKDDKKDARPAEPVKPIKVDLDGLAERVVALPVAERNYDGLAVAADGALFYLQRPQPGASNEAPQAERRATAELWRFDFEERKAKQLRGGVADFSFSEDRKKLLLTLAGGKLEVGEATEKLDSKPLDLAGLRMRVDLRAEWKQIFDEAWWMQKEFFYDPGMHGLDWQAVYDRYLPQLAHVQRREDLNDLLVQMIAELQVGHNRLGGGDVHQETPVAVGLLGADFTIEQGRYRIARLYAGDRLNPHLRAPLAAAGLGVKEGDFILAIGGHELRADTNLYALLENTVGRQVVVSIARDAAAVTGQGRRDIVVEPIANDGLLRRWAWIEGNRQYVQKKTGGKVAYVYMPDTAGQGFEHFNRMFFAQVDKQALIVDDRRNGGGQAANYVTELLARPYLGSWKDRDGLVFDTPGGAIYGPKAMLIDQDAGSGGDFMPYAFKRTGLGPLIGKRTWGGLIGISVNPPLIDGGFVTVPYFRFFTPEGEWRIENEGVAPDQDVELDPAAVNRGEDSQLDAAIADVMKRLDAWKPIQRKAAPSAATLGR